MWLLFRRACESRRALLRETNPVRGHIVIAVFVAVWLLLGLMLRGIAGMSGEPRRTGSNRAA